MSLKRIKFDVELEYEGDIKPDEEEISELLLEELDHILNAFVDEVKP